MKLRAARATVVLLGLVVGCSGGGGGGRGGSASTVAPTTSATGSTTPGAVAPATSTAAPRVAPPLAAPQGMWLKGDFHVHTNHSGDATKLGDDIATVIKCVERAGLDFTTISDHRDVWCLTDPQFIGAQTNVVLIAGEEWGQPGHAGAHGLTRAPIYHTQDESQGPAVAVQRIQDAIDDIHAMGGIFVINHPMDTKSPWVWPADRVDGMEVWNQSWAFRSSDDMTTAYLDQKAQDHKLDQPGGPQVPAENRAAATVLGGGQNWQRLKLYEEHLKSGRHFSAIGGGDSHYLFLPGQPTTQVFATARTKDAIMEAVKKGRTQVLRTPSAPPLRFSADRDGDGVFESILGDSIPLGSTVTFRVHVENALGGKLDLVKNGQVVQQWPITSNNFDATFTDKASSKSWYRVNCWEKLDLSNSHVKTLRTLVMGSQAYAWLSTLFTTLGQSGLLGSKVASFAQHAQDILDSGGPGALYMLIYAKDLGIQVAPVPTNFPRLELPDDVSKAFNVAIQDSDYCPGVLTSPIWVE